MIFRIVEKELRGILLEHPPRVRLEIVIIAGEHQKILEGFDTLTDRLEHLRRPRYVVVLDPAGSQHCIENKDRYPFQSVWLLVTVGMPQLFPFANSFVCASGKVVSVGNVPVPESAHRQMADAIRAAGRTCTF